MKNKKGYIIPSIILIPININELVKSEYTVFLVYFDILPANVFFKPKQSPKYTGQSKLYCVRKRGLISMGRYNLTKCIT